MRRSELVLLASLCGVLATSCARPEPRNLLLVTFDTTRADAIGCYGNPRSSTPNLDRLAAEGARFAHAYTAIPITAPSHSTILTGMYPPAHGVRDNGLFVLADTQTTLAEILRRHGYATGAAIGSYPLTARFGLDQGFDFFDDHVTQRFEDRQGHVARPKASLYFDERPAGWVNQAILPWLQAHAQEPFFAWVHYFDAHQPLEPPPPYDELFATDPYYGEIAYADESLGVLLDRLRQTGVYDRTVVVVVADHGEGRGDHGESTHSMLLYDATLHVPLIVRSPGGAAGTVVQEPVGTVDIVPTVLDLLALPAPSGLQGRSLAPWVHGGSEAAGESPPELYAETLSPRLSQGWGELRAIVADGHKLVFGPRPELFDLAADPHELHDLFAAEPTTARDLERRLRSLLDRIKAPEATSAVSMDESTRQKLMALGYIHGSGGEQEPIEDVLRTDGTPPQDRVADNSDWSAAKDSLFRGLPQRARELASRLAERDPGNSAYLELLAQAEIQMGLLEEALATIERARQAGLDAPGQARLRLLLVDLYRQRGDRAAARESLQQSLGLRPSAAGYYLLAELLREASDVTGERQALERSLEVDSSYVPARVDLAVWNARQGKDETARAAFERALADQPYYPPAHYNYGAFLLQTGDVDAAAGQLGRAAELAPDYPKPRYALFVLELEAGHLEAARSLLADLERSAPDSAEARQARGLLEGAS